MPLADFNAYKSNAGCLIAVNTLTPILGSGSFRFSTNGVSGAQQMSLVAIDPPYQHGVTEGRLRMLFRGAAFSSASGHYLGIAFMQSQEDLTGGAGSCYAWMARTSNTSNTLTHLSLRKFTSGVVSAGGTLIGSEIVLSPALALNDVFALEVQWRLDIPELGGLEVIGRFGTATDYSDLTDQVETVITTSVLTSTVGEGPFLAAAASTICTVDLDYIQMFGAEA